MFTIVLAFAASFQVVDSVRVESRWGGFGQPSATTYAIVHRDDHYYRRSATVPQEAVERFVAAITAAPVERKTALRGLVNREWLFARANEPHDDVSVPVCSSEAKRRFEQHLANPEEAFAALDRYFSARRTDDYPFVSIDVTFHDGHTVHLESRAQPALMLPWNVGNTETWNPEIPRALVNLLPSDAEPRLADRNLAKGYVEQVAREMSDSTDDLEERCLHRNFLAAVEKQFQIVRVYHGSPGDFTAYVRRPDFPSNLVLTLVIRDDDKPDAQEKLNRSVQRTTYYVNLAHDYVIKHPEKHFTIWCADAISVEGNERAVEIEEYDPASGIVSHPRVIRPDGTVTEDGP
jgi:hypothetical protein